MRILLAIALLLTACDAPRSLEHDIAQPLVEPSPGGPTPTHGYWALRAWPTLVLSESGSCPVEQVDEALEPFLTAGIAIQRERGPCRPTPWHIEDGRICLEVDDEGLYEDDAAGSAWWDYHPGSESRITVGGIRVMSSCNPMVIAHEVGHVLGLGHSEDTGDTMYPAESDVMHFDEADLASIVARREADLASR